MTSSAKRRRHQVRATIVMVIRWKRPQKKRKKKHLSPVERENLQKELKAAPKKKGQILSDLAVKYDVCVTTVKNIRKNLRKETNEM